MLVKVELSRAEILDIVDSLNDRIERLDVLIGEERDDDYRNDMIVTKNDLQRLESMLRSIIRFAREG